METTASFTVPEGKKVYVQGFISARYQQRATITGGGASSITLMGGGEDSITLMGGGEDSITLASQDSVRTTPPTADFTSNGDNINVKIEHNSGSGWVRSEVKLTGSRRPQHMGYNALQLVFSEDANDYDYNDCVIVFYFTTHED